MKAAVTVKAAWRGCGVFSWWHRRKRHADRTTMWTALREAAAKRHPDDEEAAVLLALRGWLAFLGQDGQDHWHCPCADEDVD